MAGHINSKELDKEYLASPKFKKDIGEIIILLVMFFSLLYFAG